MTDPELAAMEALLEELASLDRVTIGRVLTWVAARYGVELYALQTTAPNERKTGRRAERQRSQADIDALLQSA